MSAGNAHGGQLLGQILFRHTAVDVELPVQVVIGLLNVPLLPGELTDRLVHRRLLGRLLLGGDLVVVGVDLADLLLMLLFVDVVAGTLPYAVILVPVVALFLRLLVPLVQQTLHRLPACPGLYGVPQQDGVIGVPVVVGGVRAAPTELSGPYCCVYVPSGTDITAEIAGSLESMSFLDTLVKALFKSAYDNPVFSNAL